MADLSRNYHRQSTIENRYIDKCMRTTHDNLFRVTDTPKWHNWIEPPNLGGSVQPEVDPTYQFRRFSPTMFLGWLQYWSYLITVCPLQHTVCQSLQHRLLHALWYCQLRIFVGYSLESMILCVNWIYAVDLPFRFRHLPLVYELIGNSYRLLVFKRC